MIFPIKSFPHLVTHKKKLIKFANFFHVKCLGVGFCLHIMSQTLLQQIFLQVETLPDTYVCVFVAI